MKECAADLTTVSALKQSLDDELVKQATQTGMVVNSRKTKEMLIGSIRRCLLLLSGTTVERVMTFKLLGVHVANDERSMSTQNRRKSRRDCTS